MKYSKGSIIRRHAGVAIGDRDNVGAERLADRGVARDGFRESLTDQRGRQIAVVEPRGDPMGDRLLQRLVIENRGGEHEREPRLPARGFLGLLPDAGEQRIIAGKPDDPGRKILRHWRLLTTKTARSISHRSRACEGAGGNHTSRLRKPGHIRPITSSRRTQPCQSAAATCRATISPIAQANRKWA